MFNHKLVSCDLIAIIYNKSNYYFFTLTIFLTIFFFIELYIFVCSNFNKRYFSVCRFIFENVFFLFFKKITKAIRRIVSFILFRKWRG